MKELISIDELGILVNTDLDAMADSRYVADVFGKDHNDVLRSIQALIEKSRSLQPQYEQQKKAKADKAAFVIPSVGEVQVSFNIEK